MRIDVSGLRTPQSKEELEVVAEGVIHPLRVLWSWDAAKVEAERLNALNGPKGDYYYVVGVKVEEPSSPGEGQ